jgi:hypothetical protein
LSLRLFKIQHVLNLWVLRPIRDKHHPAAVSSQYGLLAALWVKKSLFFARSRKEKAA